MSTKSDRQAAREAAREAVAKYHESQLAVLVERVGHAIDCFRVGELDAFDVGGANASAGVVVRRRIDECSICS